MLKPKRFNETQKVPCLSKSSSPKQDIKSISAKNFPQSLLSSLLIVFLLGFLAYQNALKNEFSYDDLSVVVENYYIKSWDYLPSLLNLSYFSRFGEESYRPIVTLTYFLDYGLWGLSSIGFHLTNVFLHLCNSILAFLVFRKVFNETNWVLIASILFAVHPVATEAVNAIGFREELLTVFFGLISLLCFWNSLQHHNNSPLKICLNQIVLVLFFALALFSKENAIVMPFLFLAIYFLSKGFGNKGLGKNEYRLLVLVLVTFLIYVFFRFYELKNPNPTFFSTSDIWTRTLTGVSISAYYLKLLLFPFPLTAAYVFPKAIDLEIIRAFLSLGFFLGVSICVYKGRNRKLIFGWFWILIALAPILNIYPISNPIAERYLYFPLIGGVLFFSECIRLSLEKVKISFPSIPKIVVLVILSGFLLITINRNSDWRSSDTLWLQASQVYPKSSRALNGLGISYMRKNQIDKAILAYKKALAINPKNVRAYSNLGLVYHSLGDFTQSEQVLTEALSLNPNNRDTLTNLASSKIELEKYEEASQLLARAIEVEPFALEPHIASGLLNVRLGRRQIALAFFLRAADIRPDFREPWNNIGALYGEMGNYEKSVEFLKVALKIAPNDGDSNLNLAVAFYLLKDYENAKKYAKISYRLGKKLPNFLTNLSEEKTGN